MKKNWTTVAKCGFPDGEAVAVRAYDFEKWCLGVLGSLKDGTRTLKCAGDSFAGSLDPRNQIRKQTISSYTKIVYVREDGAEHEESVIQVER